MKATFLPLFLAVSFSVSVAEAQVTPADKSNAYNSLANQYNNLRTKSNSYQENNQEYKVVKLSSLDAFWKNVQDSMNATERELQDARKGINKELTEARANVEEQQKQLQAIKQETALKEQEIQKSANQIANISVLGLDMDKQNYVILNFGIIITLLIALGVIMLQYRSSKVVADEKRKAYDTMDQELNEYKKNARERELKIKRELQTEMNRVEELKQQVASLQKHPHA